MIKRHKSPFVIMAAVAVLWLVAFPFFHDEFLTNLFYMPFVGAAAAIVANITPAAAGIVYFPVLTHLSISPITVSQFNLIIQAYGMGLGTFRWFLFNRKLFLLKLLPLCMAGGFAGEILSMVLYPISSPELLSLVFNFIAFLFTQIIFLSLLRNSRYPNRSVPLTPVNISILLFFSFIGGMLCGWIGFGIDTIFYFILTVVFRVNPAISIVTSIALMAAMSISGTVLNYFFHSIPFALWYSAIPGVTVAGLFLAAYIAVKMGSRNILLLFTFFLSIDFLTALWTQESIPLSSRIRTVIIMLLAFYVVGIHIKIVMKNIGVSPGEFNAVGETELEQKFWKKDKPAV